MPAHFLGARHRRIVDQRSPELGGLLGVDVID
jgi:hypothetical protein